MYFDVNDTGKGNYSNNIHMGADTVILPAEVKKYESLLKPLFVHGGSTSVESMLEHGTIWSNNVGTPFSETSKLLNVYVTSPKGQVRYNISTLYVSRP